MCEEKSHKYKIMNEKIAEVKAMFGKKRMKIYTLQCEICGVVRYNEVPAGIGE